MPNSRSVSPGAAHVHGFGPPSHGGPGALEHHNSPDATEWSLGKFPRAKLAPLVLIAALGLLFFARLLFHPSWVLYTDYSDLLTYQIPQMRYLVSSWQQTGEQPLWCPYSFAGMPFVHDVQVGAFYPPHLPLYHLPEAMMGTALSWLIVAHVIIAGWTMYLYARSRGLNQICAVVAALGYMFSGKWMLHLVAAAQYVVVGLAWLPLILLLLERSLRGGGIRFATWAGAALALVILGSHPQITFYVAVLMAIWTLPVALNQSGILTAGRRQWRKLVAGIGQWLALVSWCTVVALALAAVQLLPTLEAATQTTRSAVGMPPDILKVLLFNILGLVGPAPQSLPITGWENRTGLTVLWIATALLAPIAARGKAQLRLEALICLGLIVFGLGGALFLHWLPGFRLFRHPSRMFLLVALPVALLAATGAQAMFHALRSHLGLRRTMRHTIALVVTIGLVSTGLLCSIGGPPLGAPLYMYWGSLLVTLPAAWWLLSTAASAVNRWPGWTDRRFELAWAALLLVDLWAMEWPLVDVRPQPSIYQPSSCIQHLIERGTDHDRILDREVPDHGERSALGLALPLIRRLEALRGYNPIDIHRYKEYIQFISDDDRPISPGNGIPNFALVNKNLLDFLAVRYLVQPSDLPAMIGESTDIAHDSRWKNIDLDPAPEARLFVPAGRLQLPPFTVYENRDAFPHAFIVPRAEPLPERTRVLIALKEADLRQVVFLEDFLASGNSLPPSRASCRATISSYEPNHVAVEVDSDAPGYLVLSDPWYPGWACAVDGQPARLYRANYAFRATAVPAGKHRVRFDFAPTSFRQGKVISGVSLAAVAVLGLATIFGRLRRGRMKSATSVPTPANPPSEMSE